MWGVGVKGGGAGTAKGAIEASKKNELNCIFVVDVAGLALRPQWWRRGWGKFQAGFRGDADRETPTTAAPFPGKLLKTSIETPSFQWYTRIKWINGKKLWD